jgi:hypothetical protein
MNPIEHGASVGDHLDRTQEVAGSSPASSRSRCKSKVATTVHLMTRSLILRSFYLTLPRWTVAGRASAGRRGERHEDGFGFGVLQSAARETTRAASSTRRTSVLSTRS